MLSTSKSLLTKVLATTILAFAAAPASGQGLVSVGHGTFQAFTQPVIIGFTFVVVETHDGSTRGLASFSGFAGPGSAVVWRVTSHMRIGATVLFAGEVILNIGNDPNVSIGQTVFTAVNDNGSGSPDQIASLNLVPTAFGNPTIQQIVAIIGPPTPGSFTPVLSGNILTRQ